MQNEKNKLFVNSLPYEIDDEALEKIFSAVEGVKVIDVKVIVDKFNDGRSKGFGFVTLENEEMAQTCITELNGSEVSGRQIFVNVAKPQEKRDSNRSGGFNGGGRRF
ncbi:MAG: RNA-binding protein [Patescibacteria group bacterium]|nr:RNA-binding protein [Patescibacteria group bacterium]